LDRDIADMSHSSNWDQARGLVLNAYSTVDGPQKA
jgi:hypothetical protein